MKNWELNPITINETIVNAKWKCLVDVNIDEKKYSSFMEDFFIINTIEAKTFCEQNNTLNVLDFVKSKLDVVAIEAELDQKIADQLK